MMMKHASNRKPLLAILVLACLLLLPLASSAPLSRSLSLRKNQPSGNNGLELEVPAQGVLVGADQGEPNHGEVVTRMDIEVNDYPGSGASNRHEPRSPGRV
ncbi:hypothetical protein QOZ80_1BG0087630 [Eleusine coracana subsp. coracana]|nr:hypothetical protein QOZ80_1BG0087630 [Eleusine coracana subsp. coracana]